MPRATVTPIVKPNGVWDDGRFIHALCQLIINAGDYATEIAVGDLLLVTGEYRQVSSIASDLSLVVGSAYSNNTNDTQPRIIRNTAAIRGTVDVTASATVNGVSTFFTKDVVIGDYLVIGTATIGEARKVIAINSDTQLVVDAAFTDLANDTTPFVAHANDVEELRGQIDPAASTTVTGIETKFAGYGLRFSLRSTIPGVSQAPVFSDIQGREGFYYNIRPRDTEFVLAGSIDPAASVTVTGVATRFTSQLKIGDEIVVSSEQRIVTAIASDTSLTVNRAFSDNANDVAPVKIVRGKSIADLVLTIRGLNVVGGAAAAGTDAVSIKSGVISKESAGNSSVGLSQVPTGAIADAILNDYIEAHMIFPKS